MSDEPISPSMAAFLVEIRYLREGMAELKRDRAEDKKDLLEKIEETNKKVSEMQVLVNKYRGGLAVILGAGALVGWIISNVSSGIKLWPH